MIEFEKISSDGLYRIGATFSCIQANAVFDEAYPGNKKFIDAARSCRDYGSYLDDLDLWNVRGVDGKSIGEDYLRKSEKGMAVCLGAAAVFTGGLLALGKFSELEPKSLEVLAFGVSALLDFSSIVFFSSFAYGRSVVNRFVRDGSR